MSPSPRMPPGVPPRHGWLPFALFVLRSQLGLLPVIARCLLTGKCNPFQDTGPLLREMDVRFRRTRGSAELAPGEVMVLCNHRSWSDFFIDCGLTGGASYLSRMMVALGLPCSAMYGWLTGCVWFFNRRRGLSRDWFAQFFKRGWAKVRPGFPVIVYPEGHRNLTDKPLKLKTGVLEVAYKLGVPVQAVICTNKELVLSEKTLTMQRGVTCTVAVSKLLHPRDFASLEAWFAGVTELWEAAWQDAYSAEAQQTAPLKSVPLPGAPLPRAGPAMMKRVWLARGVCVLLLAVAVWRVLH